MTQLVNPYVAGPPIQDERKFFGHQDTLDWVAQGLRNPTTNSLVLFGQRGIGKTTLLLQLGRTLPADTFLPVYFDLYGRASSTLGQVLVDLTNAVTEQAGLEQYDPEAFDDRGLFFSRTFLPQVYAALGQNRRLVFLLDEFDVLDEATEEELPAMAAAKSLFRFMRRVMTQDSRPAFVFAIGRRIDDLALDFTATFKASLVREVWVLDRESAEAIVRQAESPGQPGRNGALRFTNQAVDRILSLTSCHPYLTQLLCQQIWERAYTGTTAAPPRIDVPQVEAAVPDAIETGDQALLHLWDGLSLAEKIYAATLAGDIGEGEIIAEERGMQLLTSHAARLRTQEVELVAPRDLVRRRILDMTGEQEHRFTVEFFRRWVSQRKSIRDVKGELDQVDPLAVELFDIGQEFLRRNRWKMATRYFRDALAVNPHHFYARLRLGETLLQLAQLDEAIVELTLVYKQDQEEARSSLTRALVARAIAREKVGDEDQVLADCERALQVSPDTYAAQKIQSIILMRRLGAKAQNYEQEKQWAKAIGIYEQLVSQSLDEKNRAAWGAALERCRKEDFLTRSFDEGTKALKKENWRRAQKAFAQVVYGRPDYAINKQLAARLLLQAVLRKPVRKYRRVFTVTLAIAVLVIVTSVFHFQPWKETQILPPVKLPESWEHVRTYRFDTNRDGNQDWIVLYRFDLPAEAEQSGSPIAGVVYQSDDRGFSASTSYDLRPPDGDYLCECECSAVMEDVLSGLPGSELVVRDRCNDQVTRLTIFYWEPNEGEYLPKGHFIGSRIEVGLNSVTVDQRRPHRAQLTLRLTYHSDDNETYYGPFDQGILVAPVKYEQVCYQGELEDVALSPYPEKVVFSFYRHYTDDRWAAEHFTEEGWERLEQCAAGRCGCTSARSEIIHVRVTDLQSGEDIGSDRATFDLDVVCERRDGALDDETSIRWYLVRQDGRWKLDNAEVIPAEEQ